MANLIKIGDDISSPDFTFDDDVIMSINGHASVNVIAKELSADSFEATINFDDADGDLRALEYATCIFLYQDDALIELSYFTNVKRIGKYQYTIYGTSFIGLLDKEPSYGGFFTGAAFKNAVMQMICADGVEKYMQYSGFTQRKTTASGSYQYGVFLSEDGFGEATYTSKIEVKFKCTYYTSSYGHVICGSALTTSNSASRGTYYGIATMPSSGKYDVNLYYNGRSGVKLLDDVMEGDIVTISVDPTNGEATASCDHEGTITTNTVAITAGSDSILTRLYTGGFGKGFLNSDDARGSSPCRFYYYYYRVYDKNDNLLLDVVPLFNLSDNRVYLKNSVTGYVAHAECAVVDETDIINDESAVEPDAITISALQQSILGNIDYDPSIEALPVYGWIPVGTKRNSLYHILFSARVSIVKRGSRYLFTRLSNDIEGNISRDSIYNVGSVSEKEDVRNIELTEHDFTAPDDVKKIFDNISSVEAADCSLVQFSNAPIYGAPTIDETSGSFEIIAYNCNAAIVSGRGRIVGTPYIHGKKILKRKLSGTVRGKTVSVTNATMVTALNSEAVMDRLAAYYDSAYKVSASFIYGNSEQNEDPEKCGSRYSFTDTFDDDRVGFLQSMALVVSNKAKANGDFICGYTSPESSDYTHFVRLTGSGTWTLPEGVTKIRAIIIGGGSGGESGYAGEDGDNPTYDGGNEWRTTKKAEGGNPGLSGASGKIYAVTIQSPSTSYSYSCGTGGAGGAGNRNHTENNPGASGTDTTFGSYSSAQGEAADSGFTNYFDGIRYAYKQPEWSGKAGRGGDGGYAILNRDGSWTFVPAQSAYDDRTGITYPGGADGATIYDGSTIVAIGGSGGGAIVGAAGQNGADAYSAPQYYAECIGGAGGAPGRSSQALPKAFYGCGGKGGVGGGGAGARGCVNPNYSQSSGYKEKTFGSGGQKGGDGGDGCVIIYY